MMTSDPKNDEYFMRRALREAEKAARKGEVPVGAVVVAGGKIISRGHNESIRKNDPTAHAEIRALRKAGRKLGNYRLQDCNLYVTLEPCAMCLGAMIQARIGALVFAASDPKAGAVISIMRFPLERANHKMDIRSGILADECGLVLKNFFKSKRDETSRKDL